MVIKYIFKWMILEAIWLISLKMDKIVVHFCIYDVHLLEHFRKMKNVNMVILIFAKYIFSTFISDIFIL